MDIFYVLLTASWLPGKSLIASGFKTLIASLPSDERSLASQPPNKINNHGSCQLYNQLDQH